MTIDVTSNSQYIALKQSYDSQVSNDEKVKENNSKLDQLQMQLRLPTWPPTLGKRSRAITQRC